MAPRRPPPSQQKPRSRQGPRPELGARAEIDDDLISTHDDSGDDLDWADESEVSEVPPPLPPEAAFRERDAQEEDTSRSDEPVGRRSNSQSWEAPPGKMSGEFPGSGARRPPGEEEEAVDEAEPSVFGASDIRKAYRARTQSRTGALRDEEEPVGPGEDDEEGEGSFEDDDQPAPGDENATRGGPPVKLQFFAGPDAGRIRSFSGVRMVIGRTAGCDLRLADQSVSRRHLELIAGEKGVLLRDLGSGNGTRVNGEKTGERLLQHEDEVAIGKTKFRFVDEQEAVRKLREAEERRQAEEARLLEEESAQGEEPAAAEAGAAGVAAAEEGEAAPAPAEGAIIEQGGGEEPPVDEPDPKVITEVTSASVIARRLRQIRWGELPVKYRIAGIAAAVLLLIVAPLAVIVAVRHSGPPPPDPRFVEANNRVQLARTAVREERFAEAVRLLEEAEKVMPGVDAEGLLGRARAEAEADATLSRVKELLAAAQLDGAREALAKVAPTSTARQKRKDALELELARLTRQRLEKEIDALLEAKQVDEAKKLILQLPKEARLPYVVRCKTVEAALHRSEQETALAEARQREQEAAAAEEAREAKIDEAFSAVSRKLHAAEYERASAECDRVIEANAEDREIRNRARLIQSLIPSFVRNFEDGHRKFKQGQLIQATRPLRRALDLYKQMGFAGAFGRQISDELAESSRTAGTDALARDDLPGALEAFRDALKLAPDDALAKEGLGRIAARAEQLYNDAYALRDRDPRAAITMFRTIVEVTPAGSVTHEKAKAQLQSMQPQAASGEAP